MSKLRIGIMAAAAVGLACVLVRAPQAEERPAAKHRVVFDVAIADQESWKVLLRNVANLRKALGTEHTEVEVVAYSKGLDLLLTKDQALAAEIGALATDGVAFVGCSNTVKAKNVGEKDLIPQAKIVDSGVTELVRRQEEGWSYLKLASYAVQP